MNRWGVGPIFAFLSIGYTLVMFLLTYSFYPIFQIGIVSYRVLVIIGIFLIVLGIPFLMISVMAVARAYSSNTLVTNGIFRCCRHPLYASWTVFLIPGVFFLANSWIGLTTPIFMYSVLRILVRKEEEYLEDRFGSEYLEYKKKIPSIIPYGCFRKNGSRTKAAPE